MDSLVYKSRNPLLLLILEYILQNSKFMPNPTFWIRHILLSHVEMMKRESSVFFKENRDHCAKDDILKYPPLFVYLCGTFPPEICGIRKL